MSLITFQYGEQEMRHKKILFYFLMNNTCLCFIHFFVLQVETELIDKLDILVSENKGDQEYKHLFNTM